MYDVSAQGVDEGIITVLYIIIIYLFFIYFLLLFFTSCSQCRNAIDEPKTESCSLSVAVSSFSINLAVCEVSLMSLF